MPEVNPIEYHLLQINIIVLRKISSPQTASVLTHCLDVLFPAFYDLVQLIHLPAPPIKRFLIFWGRSQSKVKSWHQESPLAVNIKGGKIIPEGCSTQKKPVHSSCQVSACRAGLITYINTLYRLLNIYNLFHLIPSMNFVTTYCILACSVFMIYGASLLASLSEHKSTNI